MTGQMSLLRSTLSEFYLEHVSIRTMCDLLMPMEVKLGKDFSKTYDLTKTYDVSDYGSLDGVRNTVSHMVIKDNYRKLQDGTLHRWLCEGVENYSDNSGTAENIGSDTYTRLVDMGIVINMNNIGRIKDNLKHNEAAVVDKMCEHT